MCFLFTLLNWDFSSFRRSSKVFCEIKKAHFPNPAIQKSTFSKLARTKRPDRGLDAVGPEGTRQAEKRRGDAESLRRRGAWRWLG